MAKIHGLIYIIVGLFISILSWKLTYQKFILFFYIGLIFVLVGAIKIILNFLKNKSQNKLQSAHQKMPYQLQQKHLQAQKFRRCHKCGNIMKLNDRFCSRCGVGV